MEDTYPRPVVNILKAIDLGNLTFDKNIFRKMILDLVSKHLHLDRAIFVLADENSRFTDFMVKNIDEIWVQKFKEYYHQYDPFKLISETFHRKQVVRMEELVDLPSFLYTEYYNDFLRPQMVYHKVISYLISREKAQGVIGFFRSKGSQNFSNEEIGIISTISPFIEHALDHITLQNIKTLQDNIVSIIGNNGYGGVLIFDDAMNLIFMNDEAKKVCSDFEGCDSNRKSDGFSSVPQVLLKDCLALRDEHKKYLCDNQGSPRYRIVKSQSSQNFALYSKIFDKNIYPEHYRLYVVSIEKVNNDSNLKENRLKEMYRLTDKEIDILSKLSRGLKNTEIACELFISEITVKKHIQKIFKKVGVKNRTTLIHRTLIEPFQLQ